MIYLIWTRGINFPILSCKKTHQSNPNLGAEPNLDCPIPTSIYKKILVKFEPKSHPSSSTMVLGQISYIITEWMCAAEENKELISSLL